MIGMPPQVHMSCAYAPLRATANYRILNRMGLVPKAPPVSILLASTFNDPDPINLTLRRKVRGVTP